MLTRINGRLTYIDSVDTMTDEQRMAIDRQPDYRLEDNLDNRIEDLRRGFDRKYNGEK